MQNCTMTWGTIKFAQDGFQTVKEAVQVWGIRDQKKKLLLPINEEDGGTMQEVHRHTRGQRGEVIKSLCSFANSYLC